MASSSSFTLVGLLLCLMMAASSLGTSSEWLTCVDIKHSLKLNAIHLREKLSQQIRPGRQAKKVAEALAAALEKARQMDFLNDCSPNTLLAFNRINSSQCSKLDSRLEACLECAHDGQVGRNVAAYCQQVIRGKSSEWCTKLIGQNNRDE